VKIANLYQGWPDLEAGLDLTDHIIDNAGHVLLEKIGFKPVKRTRQVFGKQG
jgi:hypothetical protein